MKLEEILNKRKLVLFLVFFVGCHQSQYYDSEVIPSTYLNIYYEYKEYPSRRKFIEEMLADDIVTYSELVKYREFTNREDNRLNVEKIKSLYNNSFKDRSNILRYTRCRYSICLLSKLYI